MKRFRRRRLQPLHNPVTHAFGNLDYGCRAVGSGSEGNRGVTVENCEEGAAVNLRSKTVGTSGDETVENPRDASRDTYHYHVFVAP